MDEAVREALLASSRSWAFRWERILPNGEAVPVNVLSAKVSNNALATQVKRTAEVNLAPRTRFDPQDKLRGYASLRLRSGSWHEWIVGTFWPDTDGASWSSRRPGPQQVVGYDALLVLVQDAVLDRYVVAAGTNYRDAVVDVLESAGLPGTRIASTDLTLPTAREWPPGTSKLTIANTLLSAAGFQSLVADEWGVPTSQPYVDSETAGVVWTYEVGRESVIVPGIDVTFDLFDVPNAWVAIVSEPERELISSYVNDDPNSALSTVTRGRTIVRVIENADAATQAVLDAQVQRLVTEASQAWEIAEFETGLMPFHGSGDVFLLDYGEGPKRFSEHEWSMDLRAGGRMYHRFRRTVSV